LRDKYSVGNGNWVCTTISSFLVVRCPAIFLLEDVWLTMICNTQRRCFGTCLGLLLALVLGRPGVAQDPAAPAGAKPPAAAPAEGDAKAAADTPPPETDPLVLAILSVKPTTPETWLQDIRALLQLKRPELAKSYLAELSAALPAEDDLARLQARFGSAFFLRLAGDAALQPEGGTVAGAFMRAADSRLRDAQRLRGLVDRVSNLDESAAARRLAAAELVQAGPGAVPPLVTALADPARSAAHASVRQTLVAIGDAAVEPLCAALAAPSAAVQRAAVEALAGIRSTAAIPYLLPLAVGAGVDPAVQEVARRAAQDVLGGVPAVEDALSVLARRRDAFLSGMAAGASDERNQVALWVWDAQQGVPAVQTWSADDASLRKAAQFAQLTHALAPDDAAHRILYLATALEAARREVGYDRPLLPAADDLVQQLSAAGPEVAERVLATALDRAWYGAALAAIEALAATGSVELLHSPDEQPRWLVRALVSPHRRVQVAAARAILQLDPRSRYVGSSFLPELLGYLAVSAGRPRIVIGEPRAEIARTLAGHGAALGFDADTVSTGRELILRAGASPDVVLVLLSDALDRPEFRELVQLLRHDYRTADMPIGIMVHEVHARAAERLAAQDALTQAFPPPQSQEDLAADVERLLQVAGRRVLSAPERAQHASFALDALAQLAGDAEAYGFYDLLRLEGRLQQAQAIGASAIQASRALGLLGTPGAQQTLVEFASSREQPLAARQAAAAALRVAIGRRGVLLTRSRLQQQYDLYNASQQLDRDTQAVLGSILDTLEGAARGDSPAPRND
jgi:HEAT repeat protein